MRKYEVGKEYSMRSACDHECVWTYTVVERTAATITITDGNEVKKCRVIKKLSEMDGRECIKPLGSYSMSPTLRA